MPHFVMVMKAAALTVHYLIENKYVGYSYGYGY